MDDDTPNIALTLDEATAMRRTPNQRRSRERVERILDCSVELIAAGGGDGLRMSALAEAAGISIGSLYQYFPDKAAVIQTIAERYHAQSTACIEVGLANVRTIDDLTAAFDGLIDVYYALFLAEPAIGDIWAAAQADNALSAIELAESRKHAAILVAALKRLVVTSDEEKLATSAFLVMHLCEATMRLAISADRPEGRRLVDAYKGMASAELRRITGSAGGRGS